MNGWKPRGPIARRVEIISTSVQRGDVIQVGGQPCRAIDLIQLPASAKRLRFETGVQLTMRARTHLVALRMRSRW
ncbi:hypothetical protein ABT084_01925 [Streptomyces sp. NPDC002138]|uniref:hypothetical protein n=1 Tax=Streptomyces sp. NPDC002138 TaxID=3154410 RepID=UPI00331DAA18